MKFFKDKDSVEATPEQKQEMRLAEQEVEQRQYIEYHEKVQEDMTNQVALDKSLLSVDSRLSVKKEVIPTMVQMPDKSLHPSTMLLNIEGDYPDPFSEDMTKGNYTMTGGEVETIFENALGVNFWMHIGQSRNIDLRPSAKFFQVVENLIINISRGKDMSAAFLTKTDKHVSQGAVDHIFKATEEKRKKSWGVF